MKRVMASQELHTVKRSEYSQTSNKKGKTLLNKNIYVTESLDHVKPLATLFESDVSKESIVENNERMVSPCFDF